MLDFGKLQKPNKLTVYFIFIYINTQENQQAHTVYEHNAFLLFHSTDCATSPVSVSHLLILLYQHLYSTQLISTTFTSLRVR